MASRKETRKAKLHRLERLAKRNLQATDSQVENLVLRLERFFHRTLDQIVGDLEVGELSAKEAAKALGGLETAMEEAGLKEEVGRIRTVFDEELSRIDELFRESTGKAALLNSFERENLEALVDDRIDLAARTVNNILGDVRSTIIDAAIAGEKVSLSGLREQVTDRQFANLKTELNTSTAAYNRIVNQKKAEKAGFARFLYYGPDDKVTRPFCRDRVGKTFTQGEIDSWDNGTDLPASVYLGGYNCRHQLLPVEDGIADDIEEENDSTEDEAA